MHGYQEHGIVFQLIGKVNKYSGLYLSNEHRGLHFSFQNFGVQIIPLEKLEKRKIHFFDRKKRYGKKCGNEDANLDLKSNDSWSALIHCH